jgi:hypothetical protein
MIRKIFFTVVLLFCLAGIAKSAVPVAKDHPDSVYLFSYGTNGLRFAWSADQKNWQSVANGYVFLKSDYGAWGSEKKMYDPYLIQGKNGRWEMVWR